MIATETRRMTHGLNPLSDVQLGGSSCSSLLAASHRPQGQQRDGGDKHGNRNQGVDHGWLPAEAQQSAAKQRADNCPAASDPVGPGDAGGTIRRRIEGGGKRIRADLAAGEHRPAANTATVIGPGAVVKG